MNVPEYKFIVRKINDSGEDILFRKSQDAADAFRLIFIDKESNVLPFTEHFIMLCLNQRNLMTGYYRISSGGISGTVVDPKVIFLYALNTIGTTSLILCHNHPSGNINPSEADIVMTTKIINAGKLLEIKILDHIILTNDKYLSFSDEGMI